MGVGIPRGGHHRNKDYLSNGVKDKTPTISETAFANSILEWAGVLGWRRFHVRNSGHAGRSYVQGDKGFPDLVLIKPSVVPRVVVAELKVGKKPVRPEQREWLDLFAMLPNVEIYVWRPDDWSTIIRLLGGQS